MTGGATATTTQRVYQLADHLAEANRGVYLDKMRELAHAFGAPAPLELTDERALRGIEERARASAESIDATQTERIVVLLNEHDGSGAAAQPFYDAWAGAQAELIASYEARMTAATALTDFIARNDTVTGTAHVEPGETAGLDDECDDAVDLGETDLETAATIDLPAHPRCPHQWVDSFERPADAGALWYGDED